MEGPRDLGSRERRTKETKESQERRCVEEGGGERDRDQKEGKDGGVRTFKLSQGWNVGMLI